MVAELVGMAHHLHALLTAGSTDDGVILQSNKFKKQLAAKLEDIHLTDAQMSYLTQQVTPSGQPSFQAEGLGFLTHLFSDYTAKRYASMKLSQAMSSFGEDPLPGIKQDGLALLAVTRSTVQNFRLLLGMPEQRGKALSAPSYPAQAKNLRDLNALFTYLERSFVPVLEETLRQAMPGQDVTAMASKGVDVGLYDDMDLIKPVDAKTWRRLARTASVPRSATEGPSAALA